jgi:hypothetical protein
MNAVFHTAPIDPSTWGLAVLSGAVACAVVSVEKWLRRQAKARRHALIGESEGARGIS